MSFITHRTYLPCVRVTINRLSIFSIVVQATARSWWPMKFAANTGWGIIDLACSQPYHMSCLRSDNDSNLLLLFVAIESLQFYARISDKVHPALFPGIRLRIQSDFLSRKIRPTSRNLAGFSTSENHSTDGEASTCRSGDTIGLFRFNARRNPLD